MIIDSFWQEQNAYILHCIDVSPRRGGKTGPNKTLLLLQRILPQHCMHMVKQSGLIKTIDVDYLM